MKKLLSVLLLLIMSFSVLALASDELSKTVNNLIRGAEKEYFNGKAAEAAKILGEAADALAKLKAEDPAHRSVKTLQTKYDRLKARVDKKLGAAISPAAPKVSAASGQAQAAAVAQDLSAGAKSNLAKADREMNFAEKEFAKGEESLRDKKFNLVDSYIFNAKSKIESAGGLLDRVIKSNRANPDHPEVAAAFQRHQALLDKLAAFTDNAKGAEEDVKQAAIRASADAAGLNNAWLPKVTPFTDPLSDSRLQYPGSYNVEALDGQEKLYAQAKTVFENVNREVPADQQPHELKNAVKKLEFALQVYDDEKNADNKNRLQPIETALNGWEKRFEQNKAWTETADQGLFFISKEKLAFQKKEIAELSKVSPEKAAEFSKRLAALEKENAIWVEKKRGWMERPRPFPQAKMSGAKLETDMKKLLADRGIKVIDLAIVDKDWWVQAGEFRYVTTAVLSQDGNGKYWSNISFRQIKTLTGYAPTEIWDIDEIRIRLP